MNQTVRIAERIEAPLQRAEGALEIGFAHGPRGTSVATLRQKAPCRAFFPRVAPQAPLEAILVNVGGGIVEGDRLDFRFAAEAGAQVAVTTQAAEKVYRAPSSTACVDVRWRIGPGARVDWRPQETILFEGARLERNFEADLEAGARLLATECVLFGRAARGESFTKGRLRDNWRLRKNGRLVWLDALRLEDDVEQTRLADFGFAGAAGYVTVVYAADGAEFHLEDMRRLANEGPWTAGATFVNGLLFMRALDTNEARLRFFAAAASARLRSSIGRNEGCP